MVKVNAAHNTKADCVYPAVSEWIFLAIGTQMELGTRISVGEQCSKNGSC